jgi:predicted phosphodiesterase
MGRSLQQFGAYPASLTRIVVTHHPFETPENVRGTLVGGARKAIAGFIDSRVDLILSGHLHGSSAKDSTRRYGVSDRSILLVQAGTATSTRRRGELNSFNFIRIDNGDINVDCMAWEASSERFELASSRMFRRTDGGWSDAHRSLRRDDP